MAAKKLRLSLETRAMTTAQIATQFAARSSGRPINRASRSPLLPGAPSVSRCKSPTVYRSDLSTFCPF